MRGCTGPRIAVRTPVSPRAPGSARASLTPAGRCAPASQTPAPPRPRAALPPFGPGRRASPSRGGGAGGRGGEARGGAARGRSRKGRWLLRPLPPGPAAASPARLPRHGAERHLPAPYKGAAGLAPGTRPHGDAAGRGWRSAG